MTTTWRARIAALLTLGAAAASLAPVGAAATYLARPDQAGLAAPASYRYILRLQADEAAIATARSDVATYAGQKPQPEPRGELVLRFEQEDAAYRYREAIRTEQADLLRVASVPALTAAVIHDAPAPLDLVVRDTSRAWVAMWRLAGIDEYNLVRIHPHPLGGAETPAALAAYYQASGHRYQIDWTILAAINFIESDFGRVNGPSSAGAVGPMQFMPATWSAFGEGDVNNPRDAIDAAARYLFLSGGRSNIDAALYAYNHDADYVEAVEWYADAIHKDPAWLERFYYWNTTG